MTTVKFEGTARIPFEYIHETEDVENDPLVKAYKDGPSDVLQLELGAMIDWEALVHNAEGVDIDVSDMNIGT